MLPSGTKSYILFYRVGGKANEITLGRHGSITTDQARALAKNKAGEVALGTDVQAEKKTAQQNTRRNKAATLSTFIEKQYDDSIF